MECPRSHERGCAGAGFEIRQGEFFKIICGPMRWNGVRARSYAGCDRQGVMGGQNCMLHWARE